MTRHSLSYRLKPVALALMLEVGIPSVTEASVKGVTI